jgi:hypothetical protein
LLGNNRPLGRFQRLFEPLEDRALLSATVGTDLPDYTAGATALISGSGYGVGETITLQVLHSDGTSGGAGHDAWNVTDGGDGDLDGALDGNFQSSWYVDPDDSGGSAFTLTATGQSSGESASTTFTDAGQNRIYANDSDHQTQTAPDETVSIGTVCADDPDLTLEIDVYFTDPPASNGIQGPATPTLTAQEGDGSNASSYTIAAPSVSFSDSTPTLTDSNVAVNALAPANLDPDGNVTVTVDVSSLSVGTHYFRVHLTQDASLASPGSAANFYFSVTVEDCAVFEPVTVFGRKFEDVNGDGDDEGGTDPGLNGWHITVAGDASDDVTTATVGPDDGLWSYIITAPGTYTFTEVQQTGFTQTYGGTYSITVDDDGLITSGSATGNDFGNFENYCVDVHKFVDINGDGIENGGDGGVAGIDITVWVDSNGDTVVDAGESHSGTTDENGNFEVCDIGPGAVVVTEDLSASAFTWANVSSGNTSFTGTSGEDQSTFFGNILCNAGIAKTIGFWANNSEKTLGQILTLNNDLDAGGITNALYGTTGFATGVNEFISFKAFRSWILGASAKNMSYMLSAQLAGAALNVGSGMASAYTLVTVTAAQDALITSATTLVDGQYVVQINDIIAEANAALLLTQTAENRSYLEALKTILDSFNNMTNWYDSLLC